MNSSGGSNMGFLGWLILALIICGLFGVGPCADDCQHCNSKPPITAEKQ